MRHIKKNQERARLGGPRAFALGLGITALCALIAAQILDLPAPVMPEALEADQFNQGRAYAVLETAASPVEPAPQRVVPLGSVFGIKLFTDGVIVASLSDIYTEDGPRCPAAEAGIRPGDYLLEAGGAPIESNADAARIIGASQGMPLNFKARRGEEVFEAVVTPVFGDGSFKTGMWIRDSAAGIGTLTFYDPATGRFAGLGHGICDMDVNTVMDLKSGQPAPITLCGVEKGTPQSPGQLKGFFSSEEDLGVLLSNNDTGVYGTLDEAPEGGLVEVLPREEVRTGAVEIIVTVDDSGPQRYTAEITKISGRDQRSKNLVVRITDLRLLTLTGGIVQGMSGCPILQDGKLAGAVTHVFTDDPTMGYGIFAQTMCEELAAAG